MAHGVENRPPFLDHRLVEWAFQVPSRAKIGAGRRKRLLWGVANQLLPPLVLARKDKRAIVSRNDWIPLKSTHRAALDEMIASREFRTAPAIDARRAGAFVEGYVNGAHNDGLAVWRLYTGWRWLQQFQPSA